MDASRISDDTGTQEFQEAYTTPAGTVDTRAHLELQFRNLAALRAQAGSTS